MKWTKASETAIECGELTIAKVTVQGKEIFVLYEGKRFPKRLGLFAESSHAKAAATLRMRELCPMS